MCGSSSYKQSVARARWLFRVIKDYNEKYLVNGWSWYSIGGS